MPAVTVAVFRDDDVVALEQVRLHRGRRNGERLEEEDPQDKGDQQGVDDGLDDLDGLADRPAAGLFLTVVMAPFERQRLGIGDGLDLGFGGVSHGRARLSLR